MMNPDLQEQPTAEQSKLDQSLNSLHRRAGVVPVDVVKSNTGLDLVLWLVALALLIGATLVPQYLPAYWAPAASLWVRVGVIVGAVLVAVVALGLTSQGRGLFGLMQDSRHELRRITWPTKTDTMQTTWVVFLVVVVMSILLWLLDMFFGWAIKFLVS